MLPEDGGLLFHLRVEALHPLASRGDHGLGISTTQLDTGPVTNTVHRVLEVFEQRLDRLAVNLDRLLKQGVPFTVRRTMRPCTWSRLGSRMLCCM